MSDDAYITPGERFARSYGMGLILYVLSFIALMLVFYGAIVQSERDHQLVQEIREKDAARAVQARTWENYCLNTKHGAILQTRERVCIAKDAVLSIEGR